MSLRSPEKRRRRSRPEPKAARAGSSHSGPLLLLLLLISSPCLGASDRHVSDLEFVSSDGRSSKAVLSLPPGTGPWPVIVTLHGGQGDREPAFLRTLAAPGDVSPTVNLLNEQPWAILSVGYRAGAILGLEEEDVVAGIRFARTLEGVDPAKVGVLGGSHGGHLALRAAQRMGREISCVAVGSPWMTDPRLFLFGDPESPPLSDLTESARSWLLQSRARLLGGLERNRELSEAGLLEIIAERSIEAHAEKIVVPSLFLVSRADVQVPYELVRPTIERLRSAGREVTVYLAEESLHGFYWGREGEFGARAGAGPKTPTQLEEEAETREQILHFFERCFAD